MINTGRGTSGEIRAQHVWTKWSLNHFCQFMTLGLTSIYFSHQGKHLFSRTNENSAMFVSPYCFLQFLYCSFSNQHGTKVACFGHFPVAVFITKFIVFKDQPKCRVHHHHSSLNALKVVINSCHDSKSEVLFFQDLYNCFSKICIWFNVKIKLLRKKLFHIRKHLLAYNEVLTVQYVHDRTFAYRNLLHAWKLIPYYRIDWNKAIIENLDQYNI